MKREVILLILLISMPFSYAEILDVPKISNDGLDNIGGEAALRNLCMPGIV